MRNRRVARTIAIAIGAVLLIANLLWVWHLYDSCDGTVVRGVFGYECVEDDNGS